MDKSKTVVFPVLLILVFGLAFVAGVRSLKSSSGSRASDHGGKLNFVSDTATAFAKAKAEGKLVMVKYGADWCPPCREMEEHAFTDSGVADVLKDVYVVDIDVDSPGADGGFAEKHRTSPSIPVVQFFRADGRKIGEIVGFSSVPEFKADVEKVLDRA